MAGLLLVPQGLGAALGMNVGGRLTDRHGGGRVVLVGLSLLLIGTLVFTDDRRTTRPTGCSAAALFVRGVGLGGDVDAVDGRRVRDARRARRSRARHRS